MWPVFPAVFVAQKMCRRLQSGDNRLVAGDLKASNELFISVKMVLTMEQCVMQMQQLCRNTTAFTNVCLMVSFILI
jgi:hypothetical protein